MKRCRYFLTAFLALSVLAGCGGEQERTSFAPTMSATGGTPAISKTPDIVTTPTATSSSAESSALSHESLPKTETSDGFHFRLRDDGTYAIEGADDLEGDVVIPSSHRGVSVTFISHFAFYEKQRIASVFIPDSITDIGTSAFAGSSLTSVVLPARLKMIESCVFEDCKNLVDITWPNALESIDANAFRQCAFTSIVIPDTVVSIGGAAFGFCQKIRMVTIGSSVSFLHSEAFLACRLRVVVNRSSLPITCETFSYDEDVDDSIWILEGSSAANVLDILDGGYVVLKQPTYRALLTYIGHSDEIVVPEGVTLIDQKAFEYFDNIITVSLPSSLLEIGDSSFSRCEHLTSINLPDSLQKIGEYAFYECYSLASIRIPDSTTHIGAYAFMDCDPTVVVIGRGVLTIGDGAFCAARIYVLVNFSVFDLSVNSYEYIRLGLHDFDAITGLTIYNSELPGLNLDEEGFVTIDNGEGRTLIACASTKGELVVPSGITEIGDSVFRGNNSDSIVLPEGVTSIGDYAFAYSYGTQSISIPSTISCIGHGAFDGCYYLQCNEYKDGLYLGNESNPYLVLKGAKNSSAGEFDVNARCKIICESVFDSYTTFAVLNISSEVSWIGPNFNGISQAINYHGTLASWLTLKGKENFNTPFHLFLDGSQEETTSIVLPDHIQIIPDFAFYYCTSIESVKIPEGVTSIGDSAFYCCSKLCNASGYLKLPDSLALIGDKAFFYCSNIGYFAYSASLGSWLTLNGKENLGTVYLFLGHSQEVTTNITLPEGLQEIPDFAFSNCIFIESVTIPEGVTSIGRSAFANCKNLRTISIPSTISYIGRSALYNCRNLQYNEYKDSKYLGNELHPFLVLKSAYNFSAATFDFNSQCKIIYESAFSESSVSMIDIPSRIVCIGYNTFEASQEVNYRGTLASWLALKGRENFNVPVHFFLGGASKETTSIDLPDDIREIPDFAFHNCAYIETVTIPKGVVSIGDSAFRGCARLNGITVDDENVRFASMHGVLYNKSKSALLLYPCGKTDIADFVISDHVTAIDHYAFANCLGLQKVYIPETVTWMGEGVFSNCESLTSIICEATEKPYYWSPDWNPDNVPVRWGV